MKKIILLIQVMASPQGTKIMRIPCPFKPIHKKQKAARVGNQWFVFSKKVNGVVQLYSDLEHDFWLLVETDPDVVSFCEQPCLATAVINKTLRYSIPDMWIQYKDGREEFVEVKYAKDVEKAGKRLTMQLGIQRTWAEGNGMVHKLVTDVEIRENAIKLSNASSLLRGVRDVDRYFTKEEVVQRIKLILDEISQNGGRTEIGVLIKKLKTTTFPDVRSVLFLAILSGDLVVPLNSEKISKQTLVSIPKRSNQ